MAFLDGGEKLGAQDLLGGILGQVELEEAGVGLRQPSIWSLGAELDDLDFLHLSIASSEALEAFDWNFAARCDELNELRPLAVLELFEHLPQPKDDWRARGVVFIDDILFQIFNIYGWQATEHEFQLLVVKDLDQMGWNQISEA